MKVPLRFASNRCTHHRAPKRNRLCAASNSAAALAATHNVFRAAFRAEVASGQRTIAAVLTFIQAAGESRVIDLDSTVDDIMRRWPATIRVFLDYRMNCVGCPIASFHSIEDSCLAHGIDASAFLAALQRAVAP